MLIEFDLKCTKVLVSKIAFAVSLEYRELDKEYTHNIRR